MTNEVCFRTLQFDQPWTLENYLRVGGYEVWKKILKEKIPAEKIIDLISPEKIIIVDPPRAGLHRKVIDKILLETPPRVIYLSCNLSTQARDLKLLGEKYRVVFTKLYNFFPRTPHIEGLCVLERY